VRSRRAPLGPCTTCCRRTRAASVPRFIGFAVGRTTFWDAVADYVGTRATRPAAVPRIARRFREWAAIVAWGPAR
jgi:myo-inositol catabolism protein IolC